MLQPPHGVLSGELDNTLAARMVILSGLQLAGPLIGQADPVAVHYRQSHSVSQPAGSHA